MLRVRVERRSEFTILFCEGRLVAGEERRVLLNTALREEAREVVLDFSEVSSIDAAGLGCLIALHNKLAKKNSWLVLTKVRPRVRGLLALTHLDAVITLQPDADSNPVREKKAYSCLASEITVSFIGCKPGIPLRSSSLSEF